MPTPNNETGLNFAQEALRRAQAAGLAGGGKTATRATIAPPKAKTYGKDDLLADLDSAAAKDYLQLHRERVLNPVVSGGIKGMGLGAAEVAEVVGGVPAQLGAAAVRYGTPLGGDSAAEASFPPEVWRDVEANRPAALDDSAFLDSYSVGDITGKLHGAVMDEPPPEVLRIAKFMKEGGTDEERQNFIARINEQAAAYARYQNDPAARKELDEEYGGRDADGNIVQTAQNALEKSYLAAELVNAVGEFDLENLSAAAGSMLAPGKLAAGAVKAAGGAGRAMLRPGNRIKGAVDAIKGGVGVSRELVGSAAAIGGAYLGQEFLTDDSDTALEKYQTMQLTGGARLIPDLAGGAVLAGVKKGGAALTRNSPHSEPGFEQQVGERTEGALSAAATLLREGSEKESDAVLANLAAWRAADDPKAADKAGKKLQASVRDFIAAQPDNVRGNLQASLAEFRPGVVAAGMNEGTSKQMAAMMPRLTKGDRADTAASIKGTEIFAPGVLAARREKIAAADGNWRDKSPRGQTAKEEGVGKIRGKMAAGLKARRKAVQQQYAPLDKEFFDAAAKSDLDPKELGDFLEKQGEALSFYATGALHPALRTAAKNLKPSAEELKDVRAWAAKREAKSNEMIEKIAAGYAKNKNTPGTPGAEIAEAVKEGDDLDAAFKKAAAEDDVYLRTMRKFDKDAPAAKFSVKDLVNVRSEIKRLGRGNLSAQEGKIAGQTVAKIDEALAAVLGEGKYTDLETADSAWAAMRELEGKAAGAVPFLENKLPGKDVRRLGVFMRGKPEEMAQKLRQAAEAYAGDKHGDSAAMTAAAKEFGTDLAASLGDGDAIKLYSDLHLARNGGAVGPDAVLDAALAPLGDAAQKAILGMAKNAGAQGAADLTSLNPARLGAVVKSAENNPAMLNALRQSFLDSALRRADEGDDNLEAADRMVVALHDLVGVKDADQKLRFEAVFDRPQQKAITALAHAAEGARELHYRTQGKELAFAKDSKEKLQKAALQTWRARLYGFVRSESWVALRGYEMLTEFLAEKGADAWRLEKLTRRLMSPGPEAKNARRKFLRALASDNEATIRRGLLAATGGEEEEE